MEICNSNKHGKPVYHGVGKAMVALCCKVSLDEGLDGCIYFDAKNRLIPYYKRFGARHIFGLRMIMDSTNAEKLIGLYF
jgi:predicted N-acetyltransferase YhbS